MAGFHSVVVFPVSSVFAFHVLSLKSGADAVFHSFWSRLTATGSLSAQKRFIDTFELYFRAVTQQVKDKASNTIPDLESYIAMRRDTSGCKPCWALIEYANNVSVEPLYLLPPRARRWSHAFRQLDLPDWVMEHPVVEGLGDAANDLVTVSLSVVPAPERILTD